MTADLQQGKIDYQKVFESAPALFLLLSADESFSILDASDAYLRATYSERDAIIGRSLFEAFPDNPEEEGATGTANLRSTSGKEECLVTTFVPTETFPEIPPQKGTPSSTKNNLGPVFSKVIL